MLTRGFAAFTLLLVVLAASLQAQDTGVPDTLRHGCFVLYYEHHVTDTFAVPIYLFSDDTLQIISVTLFHNSDGVEFETATPGPKFASGGASFLITNDQEANAFNVTWIAGSGNLSPDHNAVVFASLKFRSYVGCPTGFVLDTCYLHPVGSTEFHSPGKESFTPFTPFLSCFSIVSCVDADDFSGAEPSCEVDFRLHPNPFNSGTTIEVDMPSTEHLSITIYDILGRHVRTIADDFVTRGVLQFDWDGNNESGQSAASGVYFARITTGSECIVRKLVLLR